MRRIFKSKGFHQNPRVKNNSLSYFKRKATRRNCREPGSAPKVKFQESTCTQLSIRKTLMCVSNHTLYTDCGDASFSLLLHLQGHFSQ